MPASGAAGAQAPNHSSLSNRAGRATAPGARSGEGAAVARLALGGEGRAEAGDDLGRWTTAAGPWLAMLRGCSCARPRFALDIGVNSRQEHKSGIHSSCKISTQDFRLVRSRWYCKHYMPFQGKELLSYGACETVCI